eukprot:TsM_001046800 transcript=TsM_001046800 gene=TsM_001046800
MPEFSKYKDMKLIYCSKGTTTPKLWGSRVVSKASGPSDTMIYQFGDDFGAVVKQGSIISELSAKDGKCFLNFTQFWGSPCGGAAGNAEITVADVSAQDALFTYGERNDSTITTSTTFFAPRCIFPQPDPDEVDVKTSFPLSRFVKDVESFNVDFAVQGANSEAMVTFGVDGETQCTWLGIKLVNKSVDLVKDVNSNLRVFHGVFPKKTNVLREGFDFFGKSTFVIVSIDYTQSGTSPEVAECN